MQHIQVLTFFNFTLCPDLRLAGASHHERQIHSRAEASLHQGLMTRHPDISQRDPNSRCDNDKLGPEHQTFVIL